MANLQRTLSHLTRQSEEAYARERAAHWGVPYEILDRYPAGYEAMSLIPWEDSVRYQVVCFVRSHRQAKIGVVHPEDPEVITYLKKIANLNKLSLTVVLVSESSLSASLGQYDQLIQQKREAERLRQEEEKKSQERDYASLVKTLADFEQYAEKVSTSDLFDLVMAAAVSQNASDIHLEPGEKGAVVRLRIDGVLQPAIKLPPNTVKPLLSRIKMAANLKLDLARQPQDGRFAMKIGQEEVDFRISTMPSQYGETVVMRVLRQGTERLNLEELGFNEHDYRLIQEAIARPYGMIIVTGPTGSGKTTTLYAILNALNNPERKIITLEDPIEYRLAGIEQSQIDTAHSYSFADALRATLRQDPDIVMVGEIRDEETARIALNAALTGHLVLTTVHANNAVMTLPRLVDMGIEPFFLSGSINLVIAQRLVRKIDQAATTADPEHKVHYKGRCVVAEVIKPTPEFERAVLKKEDFSTLLDLARRAGMTTMHEDGQQKVKSGTTTLEEVLRVTQESDL